MLRTLSIYAGYFAQSLKARLAYKADFFSEILASMLGTIAGLLFIVLLFHRIPDLGGWSREEVFFIYGLSLIPFGLFNILSINLYDFPERYIIEGRFDRLLLRPMPTLAQLLMEKARLTAIQEVGLGIGITIWASWSLHVIWSWWDVAWLLVAVVSGAVIYLSIFTMLASLSFFIEDRIGFGPPVWNLIQFGRWPIPIFGPWLGTVLTWGVPFAFVSFFPATHFLSKTGFQTLCYATPVMATVIAGIGLLVWQTGVHGYRSTGS